MKRNVIRVILLCAVCGAAGKAQARLGETPMELERRYGMATGEKACREFTHCRYEKLDFQMDVYFLANRSVMEVFAKRGLGADEAAKLVAIVAGQPVPQAAPALEQRIRKISGITTKDEIFWCWSEQAPGALVVAGFSPLECTAVFFRDPVTYAQVHQALTATK